MTKAKNVFKLTIKGRKNIEALRETGMWGFPTSKPQYGPILNKGNVGDRIIFTEGGEPVAVGILASKPSSLIKSIFPDNRTYGITFRVDLEATGRVNRLERNKADIKLRRGVVSYSDHGTYQKVKNRLQVS